MKFGIGKFNKVAKESYEKLSLNERNELIDEAKDGIGETLHCKNKFVNITIPFVILVAGNSELIFV